MNGFEIFWKQWKKYFINDGKKRKNYTLKELAELAWEDGWNHGRQEATKPEDYYPATAYQK